LVHAGHTLPGIFYPAGPQNLGWRVLSSRDFMIVHVFVTGLQGRLYFEIFMRGGRFWKYEISPPSFIFYFIIC
jgi:hypothetical protein